MPIDRKYLESVELVYSDGTRRTLKQAMVAEIVTDDLEVSFLEIDDNDIKPILTALISTLSLVAKP